VRIVIFKLNHLGDNVVFVPVVQGFRRSWPDLKITLLTTPNEAELYGGPLGPQEVLACPRQAFNKSYRRPWELAWWMWRIRRRRPDACLISFDQGIAARIVAKFSGARVRIGGNLDPVRVASSLTEEVSLPEDGRPVTWNWRIARAIARSFGREEGWPADPPPPDLSHLLAGNARTPGGRKRVVVHSGASRPITQWPAESFASVAASLSRDFDVVWISHGGTTGPAPEGTTPAAVTSLGEFSGWLRSADLFLGNNSGPMHLANALGCPGVAVTGPTALGWDPYWHRELWTVLRHPDLYCAPCEKPNKVLAGCVNFESPMACLKYWTGEKVEAACRARLDRPRGSPP
jgi:ADP-heptose:LPS heptosyltransferase